MPRNMPRNPAFPGFQMFTFAYFSALIEGIAGEVPGK